jgi:hypothetical protein
MMLARLRGWHLAAVLGAVAIIGLTVQTAFGSGSGGPVTKVHVVTGTASASDAAAAGTFTPVPNATTTFVVGAGKNPLLLLRFSSESICQGATAGAACGVKILVNGAEASPTTGATVPFFDSATTAGNPSAHSIDRSIRLHGPGTFNIVVQFAKATGVTTFTLNNWSLTAERVG